MDVLFKAYPVISGQCLEVLDSQIPTENKVEVTPLTSEDGPAILEQMLSTRCRTVTKHQRKIILDAFTHCPLPLYLKIATDVAAKWHSYDQIEPDAISSDMPSKGPYLFFCFFRGLDYFC